MKKDYNVRLQISSKLLIIGSAILVIGLAISAIYFLDWFKPSISTLSTTSIQTSITTPTSTIEVKKELKNAISAAYHYTCALTNDGGAKCWGINLDGQIGDGTTDDTPTPVAVKNLTNAVAISAGEDHACALLSNGSIKCWGDNFFAQLGTGHAQSGGEPKTTPVTVTVIKNAVAISAGNWFTCALLSNGSVGCWGDNEHGELGDGTTISSLSAVMVNGISNAIAISAAKDGWYACALLSNGNVKCWGDNYYGQLGNGKRSPEESYSSTPVTVIGLSNAVAISAGSAHTCALISDGSIKCWGDNWRGQLGDGKSYPEENYSSTPVTVSGITNAVAISAGSSHTCALLSNGNVKCWGDNTEHQLAYENFYTDYNSTPVTIKGITNAVAIAAGEAHTCALISDGSMKCWGFNGYGQLGDGTTNYTYTPVNVINYNYYSKT
jgi:alpha-tubulin suppressor-like RCC1 family protein